MAYEFRLQDPGEGIHEAEIVEIIVSEGQHVNEGDDIMVVETDKAAVEIPSPVTGELAELRVSEGDIVEVGDILAVLNEDGADDKKSTDQEASSPEEADSGKEKEEEKDNEARDEEETDTDAKAKPDKSAEAERIAQSESQKEQKPEDIETESETEEVEDDREEDDQKDKSDSSASEESEPAKTRPEKGGILTTPAVRGLARELNIDLTEISGSGENGRILEDDVRKASGSGSTKDKKDRGTSDQSTERIKLRSIRRSTAKQMARAWREIPHVTHEDEIDITDLEKLRRHHADGAENRDAKLTLTPFVMKALAGSLGQHPRFNARFDSDNEEIEVVHDVNIGVALDTERGLLVPVIRDVQSKTVLELAEELASISEKLKQQRPDREILKNGTITITNVGSIGGTGLSPIINPPQVAIFGVARAGLKNVLSADIDDIDQATSQTRLILPVCLTFDHRVNDGADAARFMNSVKLLLSDPEQLALRI